MKNLVYLLFMLLFISCSKSSDSLLAEKSNTTPCCSVACRKGSCSTDRNPCNCTCINGSPSCSGVHPSSSTSSYLNAVWLENPEEQIPIYQREMEYASEMINNSNTTPELIALFTVIKQETEIMLNLFINNDFKLTSTDHINEYNSSVKRYGKAMNALPEDYQEILYNI